MRPHKIVKYPAENPVYILTVTEATVLQGVLRTRLRYENRNGADQDIDRLILRITWADLVAAVHEQAGFEVWPVPFETFLELPEAFVIEWEQAVYDLNPHWVVKVPEEAEAEEKKLPMTSSEN